MSRKPNFSKEKILEILREYLTSDASKRDIERKYSLHGDWVRRNLIKFAIADKKVGYSMKKLPGNVSIEKNYRDVDRDDLLRRIRELEIDLRKAEMARDAYDEMIRLAEQYYNLPIRKNPLPSSCELVT